MLPPRPILLLDRSVIINQLEVVGSSVAAPSRLVGTWAALPASLCSLSLGRQAWVSEGQRQPCSYQQHSPAVDPSSNS